MMTIMNSCLESCFSWNVIESHRELPILLEIDHPVPQIFYEGDLNPRWFTRSSKRASRVPDRAWCSLPIT